MIVITLLGIAEALGLALCLIALAGAIGKIAEHFSKHG